MDHFLVLLCVCGCYCVSMCAVGLRLGMTDYVSQPSSPLTHTRPCAPTCTCPGYLFQCTIQQMHYIHHRTLFRFESGTVILLTIRLPNLIARTRIALTAHCCDSVNFYDTLVTKCNTMFHFLTACTL